MELFNITKNNEINPDLVANLREKHGNAKTKKFETINILDDLETNQEVINSGK